MDCWMVWCCDAVCMSAVQPVMYAACISQGKLPVVHVGHMLPLHPPTPPSHTHSSSHTHTLTHPLACHCVSHIFPNPFLPLTTLCSSHSSLSPLQVTWRLCWTRTTGRGARCLHLSSCGSGDGPRALRRGTAASPCWRCCAWCCWRPPLGRASLHACSCWSERPRTLLCMRLRTTTELLQGGSGMAAGAAC